MPAAVIIELVQMVIAFLLQLFGRNPAAIAAHINGTDWKARLIPGVYAARKAGLRAFTDFQARRQHLNPDDVYNAVVNELKQKTRAEIDLDIKRLPTA